MNTSRPTLKPLFTIRGTDGGADFFAMITAGVGLGVCSVVAWYASHLLWPIVGTFGCALIVLRVMGEDNRSFAIHVNAVHLCVKSRTRLKTIPLVQLTTLSLRATLEGRALHYIIICWDDQHREIGQLPVRPFRNTALQALLTALQKLLPQLQIDQELQHFVAQPDPKFDLR